MRRCLKVVWLAGLLALAAPLAAQETQVPLDEAGRVMTVDRALAQRLGLWVDEYPGFAEARLFQTPDSTFVLEITTERQGMTARQRVPLSAGEVAELRRRIGGMVAERAPEVGLNQEGRYLLLGQTTLAGVLFYGWALPTALGMDDSGAAGMYMLTAGASFFVPFALTGDVPVTYGMANLSRYGVTRGITHGLLLHSLIAGEREPCDPFVESCPTEEEDGFERTRVGLGMLVSAAEGVGGYLWARNEEMPAGTANAIILGGDAGLLWGLGTASLVGLESEERAGSALGLAGAAAGIVAGHWIAQRRDYTWGDADLMYTAGVLGAYTGLSVMAVAEVEEDEPIVASAMLGSAAGILIADNLVRDTDFTVGQATLNRLGTLAGGLAGASIGVMAESWQVAVAGSAAGAIIGYLGTYSSLAKRAPAGQSEQLPRMEFSLHPQGMLRVASADEGPVPAPLVSVRYRF